jgi:sporulation protein YlmC with PRC-barrel domain
MAGRVLEAGLHLLDRQLVDKDGRLAGKVDDLELELPESGGPPVVTAILAGPGALSRRLGGRFGAWLEAVANRLREGDDRRPARIPFTAVKSIGSAVDLSVAKAELETDRLEAWTREHVIGRLPGAGDALTGLAHHRDVPPDRHQGSRGLGDVRVRSSDLLGAEVVDGAGRSAGDVHDVRLVQDGPLVGGFGASLRVAGLLVGRRATGVRLGYERRDMQGPLPVRLLVGWLHRGGRYVAWDRVRAVEPHRVLISGSVTDLPGPDAPP